MAAPNQPADSVPAPFHPGNLRRSVIAIPLREAIDREVRETDELLQTYGKLITDQNTAVFYRDTGSREDSHQKVLQRLGEAATEFTDASLQRIDPPLPVPLPVSLARLDGRVLRLLLAIDSASKDPVIERIWPSRFEVIIDINLNFKPREGRASENDSPLDVREVAKKLIANYIKEAKKVARFPDPDQGVDVPKTRLSKQYVFARLEARVIQMLVAIDSREAIKEAKLELETIKQRVLKTLGPEAVAKLHPQEELGKLVRRFRAIHHIWPDFKIRSCITQSISTVKVDAAHRSFTALGRKITWAVADSGIDAAHPHFSLHKNIDPASPYHADFTSLAKPGSALVDAYGHGTHVAGIIAGEQSTEKHSNPKDMIAVWRELDETSVLQAKEEVRSMPLKAISGMAPECQLVSLKVLDRFGQGSASSVITAIAHIQAINHNGRELHIHGLNLSLGYPFDPKWFGCGHSPLCVEVNRLVKSGVVVVVAAGNTGYGTLKTKEGETDACLDLTINDPGNAECAITVGSTHRDMPHTYGVSYFSSKGPTGDGRYKPDLLAPGEKIISCAAGRSRLVEEETEGVEGAYFETSGTSMAAPHVSGAIAAFLSIRREFVGEPEKVKKTFTATATDLGRDRYFQGAGLIDLMRAIQSV
jgi:serine protease AprX